MPQRNISIHAEEDHSSQRIASIGCTDEQAAWNPLALGLVIVGAAAMAIAVFLPLLEPTGIFHMVQDNTLIQHGGWPLVALAVGIAASGFAASQRGGRSWGFAVVLSLLAIAQIVLWFMDKGLRTLYLLGPGGTPIPGQTGIEASLGIALYVAGTGAVLALIGSGMLRQTEKSLGVEDDPLVAASDAEKTTKKCPDCAETVLADAHVCRYCGYRFPSNAPNAPQKIPSGKPTKVKCYHCQHVQTEPLSEQTFVCEQCGTKLTRRTH